MALQKDVHQVNRVCVVYACLCVCVCYSNSSFNQMSLAVAFNNEYKLSGRYLNLLYLDENTHFFFTHVEG